MKALAWAALALGVAACKYPALPQLTGDAQHADTGGTGDIDAPMDSDAGTDAAHTCYLPMDIGGGAFGTQAQPIESNWFAMPTSGPLMGRTVFSIPAQLNQQAPINVLEIDVVRPAGGYAINTPYAFTTTPTATFVAQSMLYGNFDVNNSTFDQELFASSGSITFTQIGEAPSSNIFGTVSMTMYREIDQTTNADVPNGCTSTLTGIQFYLRQML